MSHYDDNEDRRYVAFEQRDSLPVSAKLDSAKPWRYDITHGNELHTHDGVVLRADKRTGSTQQICDALITAERRVNAYPKLVQALLALTETGHTPEDRDEMLRNAHIAAEDLLVELGEL